MPVETRRLLRLFGTFSSISSLFSLLCFVYFWGGPSMKLHSFVLGSRIFFFFNSDECGEIVMKLACIIATRPHMQKYSALLIGTNPLS